MSENSASYANYLWATVKALQEDVLPVLPPSVARDQLINSLRVVTRLAITLEKTPADANHLLKMAFLPDDVFQAFAKAGISGDAMFPIPKMCEEVSVSADSLAGINAGAHWLDTTTWWGNVRDLHGVQSLMDWENTCRSDRLGRMGAAEALVNAGVVSDMSSADLTEPILLEYLRRKLESRSIEIHDFRLLSGGRARKTALFRISGHSAWPEWLVIQRDPMVSLHSFPGAVAQYPLLSYVRDGGVLVPKPLLVEMDKSVMGAAFLITEKMPGIPPRPGLDFFAPPLPSEKLALSIARQLGILHSLSPEPLATAIPDMHPGTSGWPADLENMIATWQERANGPSMAMSAAFSWMRKKVTDIRDARTLVHGDLLQHNLLMEDEEVSAVIDWEAARIGHPGEDLGYIRPMIEQMLPWERFMEAYRANGGVDMTDEEVDYFTCRAYLLVLVIMMLGRNMLDKGLTNDIRVAELGASLIPQFIEVIANTMGSVLQRELQRVKGKNQSKSGE